MAAGQAAGGWSGRLELARYLFDGGVEVLAGSRL